EQPRARAEPVGNQLACARIDLVHPRRGLRSALPGRGGRLGAPPSHQTRSRSSRLRSLPLALRGRSSTNTTFLGTLKEARRPPTCSSRADSEASAPPRSTTTAVTASIHFSSGVPITAASATASWV